VRTRPIRQSARLASAWLATLVALTTPAPAGESAPKQVVENLHEALLGVMKEADSLGYEGRFAQLEPVLENCFDLAFMAEKSVGRYWKEATEAEKARLVETFSRYTIANYAGRFVGYSGQHFETIDEEPALRETILVRTRLVDPSDEPVQLNYRLRSLDGTWRIIDVYFNGTVSELALRRSEYSTLLKREGVDGLLEALSEKIAALEAGEGEDSES
jgi:phospholipid transport system substrate-binding protein